MQVISYDSRLTPHMLAHCTYVLGLHDNPGGDVQFINNLFVNGADASQYAKAILPVVFKGNVYTRGAVRAVTDITENKRSFGEISAAAKERLTKVKDRKATETGDLVKENFDADVKLLGRRAGAGKIQYLEISLDRSWLTEQQRQLVTTQNLTNAIIPDLPFENVDGTELKVDTDYLGNRRNIQNPSPGPFEITENGRQRIRL